MDRKVLAALAGVSALLVASLFATMRYRSLVARLKAAEAKQSELVGELRNLALSDSLTKLANRRAGEDRAHTEIARSKRHKRPLSLLLVDVDFFKRINDVDGHLVGDQVLRALARTLETTARTSDTVARMGGEEFMVLAPETTEDGARKAAERLRGAVDSLVIPTDKGPRSITISIGVAVLDDDVDSLHELWRRADVALYESKRAGRNRATMWNAESDPPGRGSARKIVAAKSA
jgi:diguanylate cyclase (GGDEF)-like protein